jgi:hypothetical protein
MLSALAVQASMPFAALIVTDDATPWRGPFAAAYVLALGVLACVAAGPENLAWYAGHVAAHYADGYVAID